MSQRGGESTVVANAFILYLNSSLAAREVFQKALLSYSVPSTSKHKRKTLGKSKVGT